MAGPFDWDDNEDRGSSAFESAWETWERDQESSGPEGRTGALIVVDSLEFFVPREVMDAGVGALMGYSRAKVEAQYGAIDDEEWEPEVEYPDPPGWLAYKE